MLTFSAAVDRERLGRDAIAWVQTLPQRFDEELCGIAEGASLPRPLVAEWYLVERWSRAAGRRCAIARAPEIDHLVRRTP